MTDYSKFVKRSLCFGVNDLFDLDQIINWLNITQCFKVISAEILDYSTTSENYLEEHGFRYCINLLFYDFYYSLEEFE